MTWEELTEKAEEYKEVIMKKLVLVSKSKNYNT